MTIAFSVSPSNFAPVCTVQNISKRHQARLRVIGLSQGLSTMTVRPKEHIADLNVVLHHSKLSEGASCWLLENMSNQMIILGSFIKWDLSASITSRNTYLHACDINTSWKGILLVLWDKDNNNYVHKGYLMLDPLSLLLLLKASIHSKTCAPLQWSSFGSRSLASYLCRRGYFDRRTVR